MNIEPTGFNLLIKLEPRKTQTESGLYLGRSENEKQCRGIVVRMGDSISGAARIKVILRNDYKALFSMIDDEGSEYVIVKNKAVIAILDPE